MWGSGGGRGAAGGVRVNGARVLVYADVNLNIIDGSSVWLASVVEALAGAGAAVTLLSKFPVHDGRIVDRLRAFPRLAIVDPRQHRMVAPGRHLEPVVAARAIAHLDERVGAEAILVRGSAVVDALAGSGTGAGRVWSYLTDIPQQVVDLDPERLRRLDRVAQWSRWILCQTEELRGFIEATVPTAVGKTALLPPIVPDDAYQPRGVDRGADDDRPGNGGLSIVYSGKFASGYRTLEMCALPAELRRRGVHATLAMLGDKFNADPDVSEFPDRMRQALTESPGVEWVGGMTRSAALARVRNADVALGWRRSDMDASLEVSTKLLEYGACGVPAILNRTPMHERLLGHDYPLFAGDDEAAVLDALTTVATDPATARLAAQRLARAADGYRLSHASHRLAALLARTRRATEPVGWAGGRTTTVLVAGHDLKFITRIAEEIGRSRDTRVVFDVWTGLDKHDTATSMERLNEADVIFCEWMVGNSVWYSRNKLPHQRLVVRFHRFEITTEYPAKVDLDAIDAIVFICPELQRQAHRKFGIPIHKSVIVPNAVDTAAFARPKHTGHEYVLGMVGALPKLKRLDLAIDLLRTLRATDPRFRLYVKSKAPWEIPWIWRRTEERQHYEQILHDIVNDPDLAGAVVLDAAGPTVAEWLRKIGWIISTSDEEGSHVAVSEGMSSGAVPLIRNWPGATEVYSPAWVHDNITSMADTVVNALTSGSYADLAQQAQTEAAAFDLPTVSEAITAVLTGGQPST